MNPGLLHPPALAGKFFTTSATWKPSSYIRKYPTFPSSIIFSPHFYTYLSPDTSIPRYRSSPDQSPGLRHPCGASPEGPHLRDQRCVQRRQGHSGAPLLLPFPVFLIFSTTQLSPALSHSLPTTHHQLLWNLPFLSPPLLPLFIRLTPLLLLLLKEAPPWAPHLCPLLSAAHSSFNKHKSDYPLSVTLFWVPGRCREVQSSHLQTV